MNLIRRFLCSWFGIHDLRYASRYTKPGFESRARCQWCEKRLWTPTPDNPRSIIDSVPKAGLGNW